MNPQRNGNVAPIAFSGQRVRDANSGTSATTSINYDKATINTGEMLNLESGVFTATQRGIYGLSVSFFLREQVSQTHFHGWIYKNGAKVYHLLDCLLDRNSDSNGQNFAYFWIELLEAGETIKITGEGVESGSGNMSVFSGFLL